jgi:Tfp pilus assembly protein PilF
MDRKTRKEQIEQMLVEAPEDPFLRYCLAMEFVSSGDDAGAVRTFEGLLAQDGSYVPAYLQAGQACVRLGQVDEARRLFGRGIEAARRQGDAHALGEMQGFLDGLD